MSALKLDDLRKGAEQKYPDFEIEMEDGKVLGFRPVFRLVKAKRKAVAAAMDVEARLKALPEDADMDQPELFVSILSDALLAAERTPGDHAALVETIGVEDMGVWLYIFREYSEKTELGEASPSES
jgi:hypothetical protein